MATQSVFVLANVLSIRDKFCYPCCTRCRKKVHTRENEMMWVCCRLNTFFLLILIGKISAQPRTTLCIQFLDRENNDKNSRLPLGKQICFTIVWGCAEILPFDLMMYCITL